MLCREQADSVKAEAPQSTSYSTTGASNTTEHHAKNDQYV